MNRKKRQIVDAALTLFVEKGFGQTSIQDIITEAKIAKGTFYNYFSSKNECFISVLAYIKEMGDQRRLELAADKDKTDEHTFIEQIAVRMNMSKEYNLISLFESASFSDDKELIKFIKQQHMKEIEWIASRIVEIYSPGTKKYALDQAIILLGIINHFMHAWIMGTSKQVSTTKVIRFAINRLKPIIVEQMKSDEVFFPRDWLASEKKEENKQADIKRQLVIALEEFQQKLKANPRCQSITVEYTKFLLDECKQEELRKGIFESVMTSLTETVKETPYESIVRRISQLAWNLLYQ
ncbi:TetR/AcrR family transcriptional regulator [Virgibacillus soli]